MSRVLITDGEQRSTLAVARSLGKQGHEVLVCSTEPRSLAAASRFCSSAFVLADPLTDPERFSEELCALVDAHGVDVVIPMTDVTAPLVMGLRESRPDVVIPFPSRSSYEGVSDKALLIEAARGLGVPVPRQVVVATSPSQDGPAAHRCEAILAETTGFGFPLVLKPARSAVPSPTGIQRYGVTMVAEAADLEAALAAYPADAFPVLVQEPIRGPGLGVFLLMQDGEVIASFAHRRLREKPPSGGVSVYRESVPVRPDLLESSSAILRHFGWTGVAMVEFKEDERSGQAYLMEVNGRFWGSLQLAIDSGVDFPALLVAGALGERPRAVTGYSVGRRSRWLWGDLDHLIGLVLHPGRYRSLGLGLPGPVRAVWRFLVSYHPGSRFEVLRFSDPRPWMRESSQWAASLLLRR